MRIDWIIRPIVIEIHRMLKLVPKWRLRQIRRCANAVADWVAV